MKNITGVYVNNSIGFYKKIIYASLLSLFFLSFSNDAFSQELPFKPGESLNYTIHYKYGIVMAKAGTAQYDVKECLFRTKPAIRTSLSFKTTSMFDKVYKIRDTLYSYSTPELQPVFHRKYLHEGKTEYVEEIDYKKFSNTYTSVSSKRYNDDVVKFDTILFAKEKGYDMINIFTFARIVDCSSLKPGASFTITSFVGRDAVPMNIRYAGQTILDKGSVKYKTHKFEIDIIDPAFDEHKKAIEIWISDDDNRVPIKLRAKLKIGAAEAELSSFKNLKYPFDSRIEIK